MTLLFEAVPEPDIPVWQLHSDDIDKQPRDPHDYLARVNFDVCPRCCEDLEGPHCTCDWAAIAAVGQAGTPEIHIDMRGAAG